LAQFQTATDVTRSVGDRVKAEQPGAVLAGVREFLLRRMTSVDPP